QRPRAQAATPKQLATTWPPRSLKNFLNLSAPAGPRPPCAVAGRKAARQRDKRTDRRTPKQITRRRPPLIPILRLALSLTLPRRVPALQEHSRSGTLFPMSCIVRRVLTWFPCSRFYRCQARARHRQAAQAAHDSHPGKSTGFLVFPLYLLHRAANVVS